MKKALGYLIVSLPFVAAFVFFVVDSGFLTAIVVMGATIGCVLVIFVCTAIGLHLIGNRSKPAGQETKEEKTK